MDATLLIRFLPQILALVVFAGTALWGNTMRLERDTARSDFKAYQSQVQAEARVQATKTQQTTTNWTNATVSIEAAHQQKLTDLRRFYEKRMADRAAASGTLRVPGQPAQAGSVPHAPRAPGSIDEIPDNCLPLADQCADTTQQVIDLQDYLRELITGQVM